MQVQIYHAYIDTGDLTIVDRLWNKLPPVRRAQLADRTPAARAEGVGLSALLAYALDDRNRRGGLGFCEVNAAALDTPYPVWDIAPNGKPFPSGIATPRGTVFAGFSHSEGHLLVALADCPLGADIQVWQAPAFAPDRFSRTDDRVRHPHERPAATPQEVARRFAAKEAAVKCGGEGLRRPLATVRITDTPLLADGYPLSFWEDVPACVIAVVLTR